MWRVLCLAVLVSTARGEWGKLYCNNDAPPKPWFGSPGDPCAEPRQASCTSPEPNCVQECRVRVDDGKVLYVPNLSGDCGNPLHPSPVCTGGHTGMTLLAGDRALACTRTQRYWRCRGWGTVDNLPFAVPYDQPATCTCDVGRIGYSSDLSQCLYTIRSAVCNGHGDDATPKRRLSTQEAAEIACKCDKFGTTAVYTGQHCQTLSYCPQVGALTCGLHGRCINPPICTCDQGYGGALCCPAPNGQVCNGRGKCADSGLCACDTGFSGDACCPRGCSGHGKCSIVTGRCECVAGYTGVDCAKTCDPKCQHGECVVIKTDSEVRCNCNRGYWGPTCEVKCPNACSGHGTCVLLAERLSCLCNLDYGGADCSHALSPCQPPGDARLCSGRGVCTA